MDTQRYYDDFASWYERERGYGYHQMLDDLELELIERYGRGKRVLEAGCGTGLVLSRVARFAAYVSGVDLSAGMLAAARARGLDVVQGSVTALPHPDASFDVVYCVKVLAHVEEIKTAMAELARVTRPGGHVLPEFYNTRSLRYLVKRIKPPTPISESRTDTAVYTRYDSLAEIRSYLPASLRWTGMRGIRVVTPAAAAHRVPGLGQLLVAAEHRLADLPYARALGGFLMPVLQKV